MLRHLCAFLLLLNSLHCYDCHDVTFFTPQSRSLAPAPRRRQGMMLSDVWRRMTYVAYIWPAGGMCGRPGGMARIGSSGSARPAWLKGCRCALPLHGAGAYCGGLPHSFLFSPHSSSPILTLRRVVVLVARSNCSICNHRLRLFFISTHKTFQPSVSAWRDRLGHWPHTRSRSTGTKGSNVTLVNYLTKYNFRTYWFLILCAVYKNLLHCTAVIMADSLSCDIIAVTHVRNIKSQTEITFDYATHCDDKGSYRNMTVAFHLGGAKFQIRPHILKAH